MDQQQYEKKMGGIKKTVFVSFIVSMVLSLIVLVLLICYNFAGVFTIKTIEGTKYANGYTYQGWQTIYWGVGEMIIQGYTENTFDIWTCLGFYVAFLTVFICSIVYLRWFKTKGKNKDKAILEFAMAGAVLLGTILLFFCDKFWIANAQKVTGSYQDYYAEYLSKALNGEEYFVKTAYPLVLLICGIVTAVFKVFNGSLLIYQKKFALNHKKGN